MSLEELFNVDDDYVPMSANDPSATVTITRNEYYKNPEKLKKLVNIIRDFNDKYEGLRSADRKSLYYEFKIPKHSGGLRTIDAPNDDLKSALYELKDIFESTFNALYHTAAFAYVRKRCNIDAIVRHQRNESKWFSKLDFSDFFGSITPGFTLNMLGRIYPFCMIAEDENGRRELEKALDLAFLNGKLPQGTPISPLITNLIMVPIDHKLSNTLRNYNNNRFVYTRYADDMTISSRYQFTLKEITDLVEATVNEFNAPLKLNRKKSRLGSSSGSNYNLGVLLNKDNEITVGHRRLKQFEAMTHQFAMDVRSGRAWSRDDVLHFAGLAAYYKMVYNKSKSNEEETPVERIFAHYSNKVGIDVAAALRAALKA